MLRNILTLLVSVALVSSATAQTSTKKAAASDGWGAPAPAAGTAAPAPGAAAPAPADGFAPAGDVGGGAPRQQNEGVYAAPGSPVIMQTGRISSLDNGAHARAREKAAAKANRPAPVAEAVPAAGTTGGVPNQTMGDPAAPAAGTTGATMSNAAPGSTAAPAAATKAAPAPKKVKVKTKAAEVPSW